MIEMPFENKSGLTIRQLKELIRDLPEVDPVTGEEYEVWCTTGRMVSSPATGAWRLNRGDLLLDNHLGGNHG